MADYFASFWTALEATISSTWPSGYIYRATQSRRINWRDLIESGDVTKPFVAISIGRAEPTDQYGVANRTHIVPVALYYCRDGVLTQAEAGTYRIVERLLEKLGKDMVDAVLDSTATAYQVVDEPTVDAGDGNPANTVFIDNGANVIAVEVAFNALIGES